MASVQIADVVVRANCASNGKNLGMRTGTYSILEERDKGGTTWYRIGENEWVASGSGVDVIADIQDVQPSESDPDMYEQQSQDELQDSSAPSSENDKADTSEPEPDDSEQPIEDKKEPAEDDGMIHEEDDEGSSDDDEYSEVPDNLDEYLNVGDKVTFSGNRHFATSSGDGGAYVKPCMAVVTAIDVLGDYPVKLHRCNSAGVLIKKGSMGYVSLDDINVIPL